VEQGEGKSATLAAFGDMPSRCCSAQLNSQSDKSSAGVVARAASQAADDCQAQLRRRAFDRRPASEAPLRVTSY
jgi:hypothetical protein